MELKNWFKYGVAVLLMSCMLSAKAGGDIDLKPIKSKISSTKTGMIIGLQKGKYTGFELGMERQWKEIKLKSPFTMAATFNMEYQFGANVIGFKGGPWMKFGRMDFTYGANATFLSDFEDNRFGVSPALGFKLLGFHAIASYNFVFGPERFSEYNKMHVSLRYYISKSRKINWNKKKSND